MLLTKSNYLLGLQCPKLLWVTKNDKERFPELSEVEKAKFTSGDLIGELAKKLYSDGIDLSELNFKENIEETKEALEKRLPLFEAGFMIDNLYARADILVPTGKDHWDIVEVKSTTKVKDINIDDVSFQKYVYEKAGLKIRNYFILHVNNQFVKNGEIESSEFFIKADVLEQVEKNAVDIKKRIENMQKIINSSEEPKCSIGAHCSKPYECSLMSECWTCVPEGSVFEFAGMKTKGFKLYDQGIIKMKDVSDEVKLNDKQQIQRRLACDGGKHIDKKEITNFLNGLKYPIYYLDFETINPAVPRFDKSKPYQQIPFQYSLHIQEKAGGRLKHMSFLAEGMNDPRPMFLQSLKDNLGEAGDILVYNQSFEISRIKEGIMAFNEFEEWGEKNILPRIKDLLDVFKKFYYYDPEQKGSASIKAVLPVMSDLSYSDLDIKKGDVASFEWGRVTFGDVDKKERVRIYKALEKYCELDTLAEVEIVDALWEILMDNFLGSGKHDENYSIKDREDKLESIYQKFFEDMKLNPETGLDKKGDLRFATYAHIGSSYGEKKKILFIGLDIGRDELYLDGKGDRFQNFDDRRSAIEDGNLFKFNAHIRGTIVSALYFLNDSLFSEENRAQTYKNFIEVYGELVSENNPLKYISLINFYKFVGKGRTKRFGDKDRKLIYTEKEKRLFFNELEILDPDVIIFQGKGFKNLIANDIKYKYFISPHPSYSVLGQNVGLLVKNFENQEILNKVDGKQ